MNDMTTSTNVVRFAVDDTFLRADAITRLTVIEKMLALGLIDLDDAKEMEDLTPEGRESDDSMEMPEDDEEQVLSPGNELGE